MALKPRDPKLVKWPEQEGFRVAEDLEWQDENRPDENAGDPDVDLSLQNDAIMRTIRENVRPSQDTVRDLNDKLQVLTASGLDSPRMVAPLIASKLSAKELQRLIPPTLKMKEEEKEKEFRSGFVGFMKDALSSTWDSLRDWGNATKKIPKIIPGMLKNRQERMDKHVRNLRAGKINGWEYFQASLMDAIKDGTSLNRFAFDMSVEIVKDLVKTVGNVKQLITNPTKYADRVRKHGIGIPLNDILNLSIIGMVPKFALGKLGMLPAQLAKAGKLQPFIKKDFLTRTRLTEAETTLRDRLFKLSQSDGVMNFIKAIPNDKQRRLVLQGLYEGKVSVPAWNWQWKNPTTGRWTKKYISGAAKRRGPVKTKKIDLQDYLKDSFGDDWLKIEDTIKDYPGQSLLTNTKLGDEVNTEFIQSAYLAEQEGAHFAYVGGAERLPVSDGFFQYFWESYVGIPLSEGLRKYSRKGLEKIPGMKTLVHRRNLTDEVRAKFEWAEIQKSGIDQARRDEMRVLMKTLEKEGIDGSEIRTVLTDAVIEGKPSKYPAIQKWAEKVREASIERENTLIALGHLKPNQIVKDYWRRTYLKVESPALWRKALEDNPQLLEDGIKYFNRYTDIRQVTARRLQRDKSLPQFYNKTVLEITDMPEFGEFLKNSVFGVMAGGKINLKYFREGLEKGKKPTIIKLGTAIERQHLPNKMREFLGEITDPMFTIFNTIHEQDMAITQRLLMRWLSQTDMVSKNPIKGTKSVKLTDELAGELEQGAKKISKVEVKSLFKDLMRKMPKGQKWGELSGKYVHPELAREIGAIKHMDDIGYQWWDSFDVAIDKLADAPTGRIMSAWKTFMIGRPSTTMRNFMSNLIQSHVIGGMPLLFDPNKSVISAARRFFNDKKFRQELEWGYHRSGVGTGRLVSQELRDESINILKRFAESEYGLSPRNFFIKDVLGGAYGGAKGVSRWMFDTVEETMKLLLLAYHLNNNMPMRQALAITERALFNYAKVGNLVKTMRSKFWGAPFATFTYKATPELMAAAIERPLTAMIYLYLPAYVEKIAMEKNGLTQEQLKVIKRSMPEFMRSGAHIYVGSRGNDPDPVKNKHFFTDLTFNLPWGDMWEATKYAPFLPRSLAPLSAPVATLASSISNGRDSMSGAPIYNKDDPFSIKIPKVLSHAFNSYTPFIWDIRKFAGTKNYWGESEDLWQRALGSLGGVRVRAMNPYRAIPRELNIAASKVQTHTRSAETMVEARNKTTHDKINAIIQNSKTIMNMDVPESEKLIDYYPDMWWLDNAEEKIGAREFLFSRPGGKELAQLTNTYKFQASALSGRVEDMQQLRRLYRQALVSIVAPKIIEKSKSKDGWSEFLKLYVARTSFFDKTGGSPGSSTLPTFIEADKLMEKGIVELFHKYPAFREEFLQYPVGVWRF